MGVGGYTVDRRLAAGVVSAAAGHALLFLLLGVLRGPEARPDPALPALLVVSVVPARPDPVREEAVPREPPPPAPRPKVPPARPRAAARATAAPEAPVTTMAAPAAPAQESPVSPAPAAASPGPVSEEATPPVNPTPRGPTVTAKPRYRTNPRPDYPMEAQRHREEGVVLLDVEVTRDGTAATIVLARTSGFPALDRAAINAVHQWTFEPARVDGEPVTSHAVVPVRFSLSDR